MLETGTTWKHVRTLWERERERNREAAYDTPSDQLGAVKWLAGWSTGWMAGNVAEKRRHWWRPGRRDHPRLLQTGLLQSFYGQRTSSSTRRSRSLDPVGIFVAAVTLPRSPGHARCSRRPTYLSISLSTQEVSASIGLADLYLYILLSHWLFFCWYLVADRAP